MLLTLQLKLGFGFDLKNVFYADLNTPARSYSVNGFAKARSFEQPYRNTEVCAVDKVKYIDAKLQILAFHKAESLGK